MTIQNTDDDVKQQELLKMGGRNADQYSSMKEIGNFLQSKTVLPFDLAIVLLGIYPNELKMYAHTKTCTQMLRGALFIITKHLK